VSIDPILPGERAVHEGEVGIEAGRELRPSLTIAWRKSESRSPSLAEALVKGGRSAWRRARRRAAGEAWPPCTGELSTSDLALAALSIRRTGLELGGQMPLGRPARKSCSSGIVCQMKYDRRERAVVVFQRARGIALGPFQVPTGEELGGPGRPGCHAARRPPNSRQPASAESTIFTRAI